MPHLDLNLALNTLGIGCWGICFWWMHRISRHQHDMLVELHEVMRRMEKVSVAEHDLIKEVHPKIKKIEQDVGAVAHEVREPKGHRET